MKFRFFMEPSASAYCQRLHGHGKIMKVWKSFIQAREFKRNQKNIPKLFRATILVEFQKLAFLDHRVKNIFYCNSLHNQHWSYTYQWNHKLLFQGWIRRCVWKSWRYCHWRWNILGPWKTSHLCKGNGYQLENNTSR